MKRIPSLFAAGVLGLAACTDQNPGFSAITAPGATLNESVAEARDFVPGQIIVRFVPGANRSEVAAAHRATHKAAMRLERTEILEVPAGQELAVAEQMSRNPNVEFAEPDWILKVGPCEVSTACTLPDGRFLHYKWDLHNTGSITDQLLGWGTVATGRTDADVDWAEAYDYLGAGFAGRAVIAILDTGIRTTHEAFAGKIIAGRRFLNDGVAATTYTDDHGHGSHVAGIAAGLGTASVPGVAYGANIKLIVGKVCNSAGNCPSSATADGIVWAADNGANVINMSLGSFGGNPDGTGSAAQQAALRYALAKNVLPVCATGNDDGKATNGYTGGISYPARFPECMAVGSTSWSDAKATYSNYGPQIELSAPGGDGNPTGSAFSLVLAPGHTSNTGYNWRAGTSMATPQVAGLAALLYATGMTSTAEIRERMKATADDVDARGWDARSGAGRINVYRALTGKDPNAAPVAMPGGTYTGRKGVPVQFDASGSHDPNGRAVTFAWAFGDGATATGPRPTHTYMRAGTYTVTLTVTDAAGIRTTAETQAVIPNIAPNVAPFAGATLLRGETYAASGSFADADPDSWSATVDYGDGSGVQALALAGQSFSLSRRYTTAGAFAVQVTVNDDDSGTGRGTALVTVMTPQQGIGVLSGQVNALNLPNEAALNATLDAASASLDRGNATAAANEMEAFRNQVAAAVRGRQMSPAAGEQLTAMANRILRSIAS